MILGLEVTLLCFGLLAAVFALLRPRFPRMALVGLVVANVLLLGVAHLGLLVFLAAQAGWTLLVYLGLRVVRPPHPSRWAWLVFIGLLWPNAWRDASAAGATTWHVAASLVSIDGVAWTLGSAFVVVKCFLLLRERIDGEPFSVLAGAASLTFVPAYGAGPICGSAPWRVESLASVDARAVLHALMRFGWGAAAFYVLAPRLRRLGTMAASLPGGELLDAYARLAALYMDFSGYTAMALAMAALFGAQLPENFNRPYLAISIREFWRRWHMSLSGFIGQYLFKPFVRKTGARGWGITLTFLATGLWHQISWAYLAWGLAHGLAMAATMRPWPVWDRWRARMPAGVAAGIGWFTTMTGVAVVSYLVQGGRL